METGQIIAILVFLAITLIVILVFLAIIFIIMYFSEIIDYFYKIIELFRQPHQRRSKTKKQHQNLIISKEYISKEYNKYFKRPFRPLNVDKLLAKGNVKGLIKALRKRNHYVRQDATYALGELGDVRAVEPLIALLKDQDCTVRSNATYALGKLGDVRAIEPLIAVLKDQDSNVRSYATNALVQFGDVRAVEPLIAVLKDHDLNEPRYAANALVQLGDVRAVEPLIVVLKDYVPNVRQYAAVVLGKLGDVRAVEPLIPLLKDNDFEVRSSAAEALDNLGWQPDRRATGSVAAYYIVKNEFNKCVEMGASAVEPLIAAVNYQVGGKSSEDWGVQDLAFDALVEIGNPSVDSLIDLLRSDYYDILGGAAKALGKIGDQRAVEALIPLLDNEKYCTDICDLRTDVALALGRIGGNKSIQALIHTAKKYSGWNLGQVALYAIEIIGKPALQALYQALEDEKEENGNLRKLIHRHLDDVARGFYKGTAETAEFRETIQNLINEIENKLK